MTEPTISIKGGAGEYEAAAIAAVIQRVFDEQAEAKTRRPPSNSRSAWVKASRARINGELSVPPRPDPGRNWPE